MKLLSVVIALATTLLLQSCTTITPQECKVARWDEVGLRDGLEGRALYWLDGISKDCAKAGVAVDATAYIRGRNTGLKTFCQPANAIKLGLDGQSYEGVCPAQLDTEFRRLLRIGADVRDSREYLAAEDRRRVNLERKLADAKTDADKKKIREELSLIDGTLRRARERVRDAENNLDRNR